MRIRDLRKRRAVCAVLFTFLLSMAGWTNATAQTFTVGNLNYSLNEDGASVTVTGHVDGQNATGELVIPDSVEQYGISYSVTAIADYAFQQHYGLTSVTIGNSVTSIGMYAFNYCSGITAVSFGNSLFGINYAAFKHCSNIVSLIIPESVEYISSGAFNGCSSLVSLVFNAINCSLYDGGAGHWIGNCASLTNLPSILITFEAFLKNHSYSIST